MSNENLSYQVTIFVYKNSACRLKGKHCFSIVLYVSSFDDISFSLLIGAFRILFGVGSIFDFICSPVD